jgi:ATP-dependent phosphofructokinase / diphosphate-dependent phosphofructokinase
MSDVVGNLLVAQSGGPTAAINSSLAGVILEAGRHPDQIEEIYGGLNGILGILNEDLVDLQEEKLPTVEGLKGTPAAALGTCRYKIDFKKRPDQAAKDIDRLFQVFEAHNIRYFFYIGGNDSQDTAHKVDDEAIRRGYPMRVIGIPKTIDNDLPHTDHCPGYGSVIKYNATTVMEVAADVGGMATDDGSCCFIEVMGRSAGWIAAGTVLARRTRSDAPHIILLPEVPFDQERFLDRVREVIAEFRFCVVVVGEGLKDTAGKQISADTNKVDAFGHAVLAGAADCVAEVVEARLKVKTRTVKLGYAQRAAAHFASRTDLEEATACGVAAVKAATAGESGFMVKLVRTQNLPYKWATGLQPLKDIANVEHRIPREWIDADGWMPNEKFIEYARPLIAGEAHVPMENGLPKYATLERVRVEKKLPSR